MAPHLLGLEDIPGAEAVGVVVAHGPVGHHEGTLERPLGQDVEDVA